MVGLAIRVDGLSGTRQASHQVSLCCHACRLYIVLGNAFLIPVTMIGYANVDWVYVKWVHSPTATVRTTRLTYPFN